MSIRNTVNTEKQKLKNMSPKDKVWYIWEYYKFHLLALLLGIGALWTIGTMIYRQSFTTSLSIAVINDNAGGTSSTAVLEAELREALGCTKKQLIEVNEGLSVNFGDESISQYGYATLAKISALVASQSLDVVIADQSAIDHYETVSAYQNLEEYLPPQLYNRVKDCIYSAKDEQGVLKPVAISLEDTPLAAKTGIVMNPPYLAVIAGSPHKEAALVMIEYLFQ